MVIVRTNGGALTEGSRDTRDSDDGEELGGAATGAAASAARSCDEEPRWRGDSSEVAAAIDARH